MKSKLRATTDNNKHTDSADIIYMNAGSPQFPFNPNDGKPNKPFAYIVRDANGKVIDEAWLVNQWRQLPNAAASVANALDQIIVDAAAKQVEVLQKQMHGKHGHADIVRKLKDDKRQYYDTLCQSEKQRLRDLATVQARIQSHNQ